VLFINKGQMAWCKSFQAMPYYAFNRFANDRALVLVRKERSHR